MDSTRDSEIGKSANVSTTGSDGQTQQPGNDVERSYLDKELERIERNLSTGEGGNGEERTQKEPGYTLPPSTSVEKKRRGRKPGSTNKPSTNSGVSPTACAGLLQGLSMAASYQITGTMDLALSGGEKIGAEALNTEDEAGSLGKALADCLDTIPNSPVSKAINLAGPWMHFLGLLAAVIISRAMLIAMVQRNQQRPTKQQIQEVETQVEAPAHYSVNCPLCGQRVQNENDLERHVKDVHRGA